MTEKLVQLLTVSAVGGVLLLCFGVVSGMAADQTIQATGTSLATYAWSPTTAQINAGGSVEFKGSTGGPHTVEFEAPPAQPSCTGIPATGTASNWTGTCTFAQAGEYKFFCPVHPGPMKGTITVIATGPQPPVVTTEPASETTDTGAKLNGKVNPSGESTMYWFKYGLTNAYGQETTKESAGSGNSAVSKSATVSSLTAGTEYHFRLFAENGTGTSMGIDRTFTTGAAPTATTNPATGIGPVSATLKGTVNPKGLATTYFFNYGTSAVYGQKTNETAAGSGTSNVTASTSVTGLLPETIYHFQVVAKNSAGGGSEVKGGDLTFETTGGPVATTGQASGVGESSATVAGVVNPKGKETKYFFNYGTTEAYGQKTTEKGGLTGSSDKPVSEQLTGLSPGTTYHFQLVAKNSGGETKGLDQTFTTGSTPPPPPEPPLPPAPPLTPPPAAGPPDTKIILKPAAKTRDTTPTIKFKATAGGATYKCSVDSKPFKTCRSPFTTPVLKPGSHKIRVKAALGGVSDPTPASCSFKVLAAKK